MDRGLPTAGIYVVAVSGGVDSMALLHMLQRQRQANTGLKLVIAHLDHGIRPDSAEDRQLVQKTARHHELPFIYREAKLGAGAGEAAAREARYRFLHEVRQTAGAKAIITAHHQDDLLETAIINLLRGGRRKGLTSLSSRHDLVRPLLHVPKKDLVKYAQDQGLVWHEDSTNQDQTYLRNYIRHSILPRFDDKARTRMLDLIHKLSEINHEIDMALINQLRLQPLSGRIDRYWFNSLPHAVAREVLATWLRAHNIRAFDSKTLERLVVAAKVAPAGKTFPIQNGIYMKVDSDGLALEASERWQKFQEGAIIN